MRPLVCANSFDYLPTLAAESVDFICTSPPYDNLRTYKGNVPPLDRVRLGTELYRVAKEGTICAVVIQDQTVNYAKTLSSFRWAVDWVDQCGWRLYETCIYKRQGIPGEHQRHRFRIDHEYVHLFLKGKKPSYVNKTPFEKATKTEGRKRGKFRRRADGDTEQEGFFVVGAKTCKGTVWEYAASCSEGNKTKSLHPAPYPDALASDLIQCFCPPNGLVLDPFIGSGTTAVQAVKLGRNYIGIDVAAEYIDLARKRLDAETEAERSCLNLPAA